MISFNQVFSGVLPEVPTAGVLSYLEAGDLAALRRVGSSNTQTHDLMTRAWRGIEASLEYSAKESSEEAIDPNSHRFREYNNKVKDLVVRIKHYHEDEDQVPSDIKAIIDQAMEGAPTFAQACRLHQFVFVNDLAFRVQRYPEAQIPSDIQATIDQAGIIEATVEQASKLQQFIKARDTLVVWEKIAQQAGIDLDLSEAYESADMVIDQAKDFSAWMEENHDQLESLILLDLSINQLISLPPEIGQLGFLKELNLKSNQLISLPPEIGQLGSLESLTLGRLNEFLGRNQLTSLPPEIGQLRNLKRLGLSHNDLTSLPPEIGQLIGLQRLDLSGNQHSSLPREIGQLRDLVFLDLRYDKFTYIPKEIQAMPNFSRFCLSGNPLPYTERIYLGYSQGGLLFWLPETETTITFVSAALLGIGAYYYSDEISSVAQSVSTLASQWF